MKRALFTMTVLMASAMSFAQSPAGALVNNLQKVKAPKPVAIAAKAATSAAKPMRSIYNGNYYTVPQGAMYLTFDKEGAGYYLVAVNVPALSQGVFTNMNSNPASASWLYNGQPAEELGLVDSDNNFVWTGFPSDSRENGPALYYAPTLVGSDSYTLPVPSDDYMAGIISLDRPSPLTYAEYNLGRQIYGYSGFTSTQYLFGSGDATITELDEDSTEVEVTTTMYGASQHMPKPISPVYIEDIFLPALVGYGDTEPLKNGAVLTMKIIGDNSGEIATLTCTADDVIKIGNPVNLQPYGQSQQINLVFSRTEETAFGTVVSPVVINEAYTIEVTGFDNPDVNVGLFGFEASGSEVNAPLEVENAYILARDANGEERSISYAGSIGLPITLTALFDNVVVQKDLYDTDEQGNVINTYENSNVLWIAENGVESYLNNEAANSLYLCTATPWDEGYYTFNVTAASEGLEVDETTGEGKCSWLDTEIPVADDSNWSASGNGLVLLNFNATELEAGKGRWAVVYVEGRGVTSAEPIIILQGNATLDEVIETGIDNVVKDNVVKADPNAPVYNLNGQRVSKATKGIVIQNGKKFVNK